MVLEKSHIYLSIFFVVSLFFPLCMVGGWIYARFDDCVKSSYLEVIRRSGCIKGQLYTINHVPFFPCNSWNFHIWSQVVNLGIEKFGLEIHTDYVTFSLVAFTVTFPLLLRGQVQQAVQRLRSLKRGSVGEFRCRIWVSRGGMSLPPPACVACQADVCVH